MRSSRLVVAIMATLILTFVASPVATAAPSPKQQVQAILQKVAAGKVSLTSAERRLLNKELDSSYIRIVEKPLMQPLAFSGCWSKAAEVEYYGAVTRVKMFTVGQTTRVCVKSKAVSSVTVTSSYLLLHGYPLLTSKGVQTHTHDVNWEGRGMAVGTVALGAGGWDASTLSQCVQLRLNADGVHRVASTRCDL